MITSSIVTYKTSESDLLTLLQCADKSSIDKIYIVDNSPFAKLGKYKEYSPKIEYLHGHGNIGYGSAHNVAIRKAISSDSTYHIVINPDIKFEDGTIERLTHYMNFNPLVGLVQPRVIYPDGKPQYLCKLIPTPIDLIFKRFLPKKFAVKRLYKFQLRFTDYNNLMNVPYLSGCFMFLRVSALKKIGLFDERFFMYPEDIDITRRIHEYYKTMFYPSTTIIHSHVAESYQSKRMLVVHIINMIKYFNKWGWFFDSKRRQINIQILKDLKYKE